MMIKIKKIMLTAAAVSFLSGTAIAGVIGHGIIPINWSNTAITTITSGPCSKADKDGQWIFNAKGWWWKNPDSTYPVDTWAWLDGNHDGIAECYYFDHNGYMLKDTKTPDGYLVDKNGAWIVDGKVRTKTFYVTGPYVVNATISCPISSNVTKDASKGWVKAGANFACLNSDGIKVTGWKQIDGYWYYFNTKQDGNEGTLRTGWLCYNNFWYFLNPKGFDDGFKGHEHTEGAMEIGWVEINGKNYYFDQTGRLVDIRTGGSGIGYTNTGKTSGGSGSGSGGSSHSGGSGSGGGNSGSGNNEPAEVSIKKTITLVSKTDTTTIYSHTPNYDDTGNIIDASAKEVIDEKGINTVTIDGADSLHLKIYCPDTEPSSSNFFIYDEEELPDGIKPSDLWQMFSGYPEEVKQEIYQYPDSVFEDDIIGNSVSFVFYSDGSKEYQGYYAAVTAKSTSLVDDTTMKTGLVGESIELPTPELSGYIFDGWYTEEEGGEKINSPVIMPSEDITYYAHFTAFTTSEINMEKFQNISGRDLTSLERVQDAPTESDNATDISESGSEVPILAWKDNNTKAMKIYSEAAKIYLPQNCKRMFFRCSDLSRIDVPGLDTSNVTNMGDMFFGCSSMTTAPNVSNWDTSNVTKMGGMFYECSSMTSAPDVSNWDTSSVGDMGFMFYGCSSMVSSPDVSNWDTSNVTNMGGMFFDCPSMTTAPNVSNWDTSNVTKMDKMFSNCSSMTSAPNVSNWNTSEVKKMYNMFSKCSHMTSAPDVSKWDTSNVTDMGGMFYGCSSMVSSPDVSNWDTSNVTDMSAMFSNCSSMTSAPNVSNWNTSEVKKMYNMFSKCSHMTSAPDVSKWDTSKVTGQGDYAGMVSMFEGCSSMTSAPDVSNWDTSSVGDMKFMFYKCSSMTSAPDVSNWDISKVIDISYMFAECSSITEIDLSSWNTANTPVYSGYTYGQGLFYNCKELKTIIAGNDFKVRGSDLGDRIFGECESLIGGAGTRYDSSMISSAYARIDGGASNPGYFTQKSSSAKKNSSGTLTLSVWTDDPAA